MIKQMTLLTRRENLDAPSFHTRWAGHHSGLVRQLPGLLRYVQNDILRPLPRPHLPEIPLSLDGVEELWFESPEMLREAQASSAAAAAIDDETRLLAAKSVYMVHEIVVYDRPATRQRRGKRLSFLRRKGGLTTAQFQEHWSTTHVAYARAHRFAERYVQNHVVGAERRPGLPSRLPDIDGIGEFQTADLAQMQQTYETPEGRAMNEDSQRFLDAVSTYLVAERDMSPGGD
jgi:uncharacterized protein (TIGR02118 family)